MLLAQLSDVKNTRNIFYSIWHGDLMADLFLLFSIGYCSQSFRIKYLQILFLTFDKISNKRKLFESFL